MGTLKIIYAMLVHIQGEAHPIYRVEQRMSSRIQPMLSINALQQSSFPLLFLFVVLLALIFGYQRPLAGLWYGTAPGALLIFGICNILSLGWTVPLAMQAGQSISREHSAQTLDLLLVTPYPTATVLLVKAAASTRHVWSQSVGVAFLVALLRISLLIVLLIMTTQTTLMTLFLMLCSIVIALVEPLQEMALAVVIGLWSALTTESLGLAVFFGLGGGILIRFVQIGIVVAIIPLLSPRVPIMIAAVNTGTLGSMVLLIAAPTLAGLLVLCLLIAGREALIYALFAWTVRRAHEN